MHVAATTREQRAYLGLQKKVRRRPRTAPRERLRPIRGKKPKQKRPQSALPRNTIVRARHESNRPTSAKQRRKLKEETYRLHSKAMRPMSAKIRGSIRLPAKNVRPQSALRMRRPINDAQHELPF